MSLESKVIRLEQTLLGLGGLPKWATDAAEDWLNRQRYCNTEDLEKLLGIDAKPKEPHPISEAVDVDAFAADVVERFKSRENYEAFMLLRQDAGVLRLKKFLDDLKAEVAG